MFLSPFQVELQHFRAPCSTRLQFQWFLSLVFLFLVWTTSVWSSWLANRRLFLIFLKQLFLHFSLHCNYFVPAFPCHRVVYLCIFITSSALVLHLVGCCWLGRVSWNLSFSIKNQLCLLLLSVGAVGAVISQSPLPNLSSAFRFAERII